MLVVVVLGSTRMGAPLIRLSWKTSFRLVWSYVESYVHTRLPRRIQSTVYKILELDMTAGRVHLLSIPIKKTKTLTVSMGRAGCRGAAAADTKIKCSIGLPCRPAFSN